MEETMRLALALREHINGETDVSLRNDAQITALRDLHVARAVYAELTSNRAQYMNDTGMAYAFYDGYGLEYKYVHDWGMWYSWNGTVWTQDRDSIREQVSLVAEQIREQYIEDGDKKGAAFANKCMGTASILAIIKRAETLPGFKAISTEFEARKDLFCCPNGTYSLDKGTFTESHPDNMMTHHTSVRYDPEAKCPRFMKFLKDVAGSAELAAYIVRAIGYTMSGYNDEQCMFILHGSGKNGKSALLKIIRGILGEYGASMPAKALLQDVRGQTDSQQALSKLQHARYVEAQETEITSRFAEGLIKSITGGENIIARRLYQATFDYEPKFKLWLATNHKPDIHGTDKGIWRRIRLIPFNYVVPSAQVNPRLAEELLKTEGSGILNLFMGGHRDWRKMGLAEPLAITNAAAAYQEEMDPVTPFILDECVTGLDLSVSLKAIYQDYRLYAEGEGMRPMSRRRFSLIMGEKGYKKVRESGGMVYEGLALKSTYTDSVSGKYKGPQ